jgi:hypothetical protein
MAVTWRLEDRPGGCRVTIEHDFGAADAPVSRLRALVIDRFFVRPVASRTLATFRALAEATAEAAAEPTPETTARSGTHRIHEADPGRTEDVGPIEPTAATRSLPR